MNKEEIQKKLNDMAFEVTTPFCYSCYIKAPTGRCEECGSDDLMRHMEGVGVEYGTEWVIEEIIDQKLDSINTDEMYEQYLEECYGEEVTIGFIKFNITLAIKNLDPVAYQMGKDEYLKYLLEMESIIEIGGSYYYVTEIESL